MATADILMSTLKLDSIRNWKSAIGSPPCRDREVFLAVSILIFCVATLPHAAPAQSKSASATALAKAREQVMGASPLMMFYYSDDSVGLASLQTHAGQMSVLAPQCYWLDSAGGLHGKLFPGVEGVVRQTGLPLMPLVMNPDFDRATAHILLHNPAAQERAARNLALHAEHAGFVGWQLDFEGFPPADSGNYVRFAVRVAARLHHDHRLLSVAVAPRFSDLFPSISPAGFRTGEWGAAFDYRGLGRASDFLVLMAYDQHTPSTPPGPVAAYDWVKAALDYAVRCVPPEKTLLGIPLYGREWDVPLPTLPPHSLAYKDLQPFFDSPQGEQHWDDLSRTAWFQMRDGTTLRTAWFDDARSLREKIALVQIYHLRGFAAWHLGVEDPEFWNHGAR
jgi:spore germination protein